MSLSRHESIAAPRAVTILAVIGLALSFLVTGAVGAGNSVDVNERLIQATRSFIVQTMHEQNVPGCNIALARGGQVIWEEGFGFADVENRVPYTPDTVFHSGSMGKTYIATAVMQLVEQGVLSLDDSINKHFTDFEIVNPLGDREITIYDYMTHSTGLTSNTAAPHYTAPPSLAEHIKAGYDRSHFPPYNSTILPLWSAKVGAVAMYSNFGMATLGYLIEVTNPEGLTFSEYVQRHVMDPLGMTSTQYPPVQDADHVRPDIFRRMSVGYTVMGKLRYRTTRQYFADYPAGTFVGTPGDHIKLLLAMKNGGEYDGHRLLREDTVEDMLTPRVPFNPAIPSRQIGLIWLLVNTPKDYDYRFFHAGAHMYGWFNEAASFPNLDFTVVVGANFWPIPTTGKNGDAALPYAISQFMADWLHAEADGKHAAENGGHTDAWKISYLAGLSITESTIGTLGVQGNPLDAADLTRMVFGGFSEFDEASQGSLWDADGFRAGVEDMRAVEMTPPAIQKFLESDACRVPAADHDALFEMLGETLPIGTIPGG
jgi:CubicO group peptidase (beta-lactamase class C family)